MSDLAEFAKRAKNSVKKSQDIDEKKDIEDPFVKYATRCGCKAYKLVMLFKKGWPDRTIVCPGGRVFFIEFKRKGRGLSAAQVGVRSVLVRMGFMYVICDAPGQAEGFLDGFLASS